MNQDPNDGLWYLTFTLDVSSRYHQWRRSTFTMWHRTVQFVSIVAGSSAIAALGTNLQAWISVDGTLIAIIAAAIVAVLNALALTIGFDARAREHEILHRQFKQLEARIAKAGPNPSNKRIAAWTEEKKMIHADEPPVLWGIYAYCWNQSVDRFNIDKRYVRETGFLQWLLKYLPIWNPSDFPLRAEKLSQSAMR